MRRALLLAALAASALVTGATVAPSEAQCQFDCPPYNRVCYTSSDCGFSCGMTCTRIEGTFTRRCR